MPQSDSINRKFVLAQRPTGEPTAETMRIIEESIPEPGADQMLLRVQYLSLDPYMRGRMSDAPSYAAPVQIGEVMVGGTVARVVESNVEGFETGDWVLSFSGWQDYALSDGQGVTNLGKDPAYPTWALGIMGMPGFTGYAGLKYIGEPREGETIVVAAATGPVGSTVGQVGKLMGCRVVGIAGGPEKCKFAVEELGFDACIDHKASGFADKLAEACGDGVDVYFENVGGKVLDAVLPLLNKNARIPVCGLVSQYNATQLPAGPDRMNWLMGQILRKSLKIQGFIIFDDFGHRYQEFAEQMGEWVKSGKIEYREEIIDGLENALDGLIGMLKGQNFGKRVIRVNDAA